MTVLGIIELVKGLLQFPGVILEFVRLLQKTPQEKHDALLKQIQIESEKFEQTGRPSWD
jgi:hypothetical protein